MSKKVDGDLKTGLFVLEIVKMCCLQLISQLHPSQELTIPGKFMVYGSRI